MFSLFLRSKYVVTGYQRFEYRQVVKRFVASGGPNSTSAASIKSAPIAKSTRDES